MLLKRLLTAKEVLATLLFLSRIFFRILSEYSRHSFPLYASIYPVKLVAKITAALLLYVTRIGRNNTNILFNINSTDNHHK